MQSVRHTPKLLQEPVDFIFTVAETISKSKGGGSWLLWSVSTIL